MVAEDLENLSKSVEQKVTAEVERQLAIQAEASMKAEEECLETRFLYLLHILFLFALLILQ